jgi:nicotinate-nucleotide adenylyltransferase
VANRRVIGLLGGSFNPAHAGHRHISLLALNKLKLDEVWWLVSPGNPLKDPATLAPFAERLASARRMATHPRIRVSDVEQQAGTRFTADTIKKLKARHPRVQFVWLMGADNLAGFHRWRRWRWIAAQMPMLVFDRAPFSHRSLRSKAGLALAAFRLKNSDVTRHMPPGSWAMLHLKRSALSASLIRKKLGKTAFLGHNEKYGEQGKFPE